MSSTHPLKMALQAVLAGTSQFVELRDPFHPGGFPEFARAFLERWRDDRHTKNAKHWDRLVAGMEKRGKSHQYTQQKFDRFLGVVHSSLAVNYVLTGMRKRVQTLLREKLNQAKDLHELAAKEQAQITAFIELFKSFGDEFPPKTLLGLQERARKFEQGAVSLRQEAAKVESWLPWVPGTRQQRSSAHQDNPGGKREDVARRAFMQALSYIMRKWFGRPNDPVVAAIAGLAFPADSPTERDVRNARWAPAVTPLASPDALAAALISHVQYSKKVAEALGAAVNSGDFPRADELAAELAKAENSLAANTVVELIKRLHAEELAEALKSLDTQNGDPIRKTPPNSIEENY
jgi:hypothetical protein